MEVVGSSGCDKRGGDRPMSWLLTNYRDTTERLLQTVPGLESFRDKRAELRQSVRRLVNLVITPSSIPDFTIPETYRSGSGTMPARQGSADSLGSLVDNSMGTSRVQIRRNSGSTTGSNSPELANNNANHLSQSSSEPVSPSLLTPPKNKGLFRRSHTISYEMIDECREPTTTNADPRSLAAMSLPHLKTKTKFGFETLSECPKTERRESLFHNQNYSLKNSNQAWKLNMLNGLSSKRCGNKNAEQSTVDASQNTTSLEHTRRLRSKRQNVISQVAPLGVAMSPQDSLESNASCCGNSPIPSRSSSLDRNSPSQSNRLAEKRKRFSSKRSATVGQDYMRPLLENNKKKSTTPTDSRRGSGLNNNVSLNEEDVQQLLRLSAMTSTVPTGASNSFPGAIGNIGFEDQSRLAALVASPRQVTRGELKFSLEYSQAKQQLRVHLQEGVSLSNGQATDGINPFVKLSVNTQRFTSNVVRNTNNPVFDKVFIFRDIGPEQLCEHKLRVKVLHREGLLRRNELLGSLDVNLAILINCEQPRLEMQRELETEDIPRELGRLQLKIDFQPNSEKLEVTVLKIKDLPCNTITGAPDPYVVLELRQPGRPDVRMQTRVKKKVTTADINETFIFHISPKIEDLNYTCLSLIVYDHEMIRSDRFMGEVRLGFGATEQSEFDHWNQVLNTPGKEFANWHMLMEEQ